VYNWVGIPPALVAAGGGVFETRMRVPARVISSESMPLWSIAWISPWMNSRSIIDVCDPFFRGLRLSSGSIQWSRRK
jgi:hypothetical protein